MEMSSSTRCRHHHVLVGARTDVNDAIHSYGGIVLHDIITTRLRARRIEKGADGLIAVAAARAATRA